MNTADNETLITLASASPQRREILTAAGLPFVPCPQDIDETMIASNPVGEVARLAREKAEACLAGERYSRWIIGADTVVTVDGEVLGKPADYNEAASMLKRLQGRTHCVLSGVAVIDTRLDQRHHAAIETAVSFIPLNNRQIEWYLDTGEWQGAAGGYRIQGRGSFFIHSLAGSYHNVVGLPIDAIYGILMSLNYPFP